MSTEVDYGLESHPTIQDLVCSEEAVEIDVRKEFIKVGDVCNN